jgi:hypothetical protein
MGVRQVTVTTDVTLIVPYNARRKSLVIASDSGDKIYISPNPKNITAEGIPLIPGGVFSLKKTEGDEPEYAWYGQAPTGSADIRVYEGFGE